MNYINLEIKNGPEKIIFNKSLIDKYLDQNKTAFIGRLNGTHETTLWLIVYSTVVNAAHPKMTYDAGTFYIDEFIDIEITKKMVVGYEDKS